MDQVLQSPELLTRVFQLLHDDAEVRFVRSNLPTAARVCSLWRDIIEGILWREPPVEALAKIRRTRRQHFASNVTFLDFSGNEDPTAHALFDGLQFPRLRKLELGDSNQTHARWHSTISQYFQPRLESLTLRWWDAKFTPELLAVIQARCPHLKSICFYGVGEKVSPENFLTFIKACEHLEKIGLSLIPISDNALVSNDLLLHLSKMKRLNYLDIDNNISRAELFERIKRGNSTPFQHLTKLELCVRICPVQFPC